MRRRSIATVLAFVSIPYALAALNEAVEDPLVAAVKEDNPNRLRMLLEQGVRLTSTNQSPLVIAFDGKHAACADLLLRYKAGLDAYHVDGAEINTPLTRAIELKQFAWAHRLLDAGADPNLGMRGFGAGYGWRYPLLGAVAGARRDLVVKLLDRGADPNKKTRVGQTALTYAVLRADAETLRILLARGATYDRGDDINNPLLIAVRAGNAELAEVLLSFERTVGGSRATRPPRKDYLSLEWARYQAALVGDSTRPYTAYKALLDASRALQRRGFALYKQGKDKDALPLYEKALDCHATAGLYYNYGNSLSNIPRLADSVKAYAIALALGHAEAHLVLYNMACAYSRLHDADNTFVYLEKAVAEGYVAFAFMRDDGDLAYVRGSRRWASWFAAARAKARAYAPSDVEAVFKARFMGRWLVNERANVKFLFKATPNTPEFGVGEYLVGFVDTDRADRARAAGDQTVGYMGEWGAFRIAGNKIQLLYQFAYMRLPRLLLVKPAGNAALEINGVVYMLGAAATDKE